MNDFIKLFCLVCVQGIGHPKVQAFPTNCSMNPRKALKVTPAVTRSEHSINDPVETNSSSPSIKSEKNLLNIIEFIYSHATPL